MPAAARAGAAAAASVAAVNVSAQATLPIDFYYGLVRRHMCDEYSFFHSDDLCSRIAGVWAA